MATEIVGDNIEILEKIDQAIAIQEMASRVDGVNEEDFDMLQRSCAVTFRLLEEAKSLLVQRSAVAALPGSQS
ncbi:hypothetical protein [Pseudoxanthomonas japonensis]|uniref:hypothetical protein n=1 Tax=Pseudoxanthomonas japonensis TaxID=69284 RepID=UPI003747E2DF